MSLKRTALSAGRWTAASAALVAAVQMIQTMVLARLLLPSEFGLMAVAAAILAVLTLIADMGLSRALIYFDNVSANTLSSLYWLNMGIALLLAVVLATSAPALGALYKSPALALVLQSASLLFPFAALGQQFRVLAEKELRFAVLARIEIVAALAGLTAAVAVALRGGGVYSLVAAILTTALVSSLLAWWRLSGHHKPAFRFRLDEARPYLHFGGYLVGDSFTNTLSRQADVFIGGLVLAPSAMGIYAVPRDLSFRISTLINPVITRVGFPVMSRMKDDRASLASIYLRTLRMTASVNFPIYVALGLFAREVVALLYGPRWHAAVVYLQILAAWGLVRSTGNPIGSLLYAVGKARLAFWWNAGLLAIFAPLLWVGATLGGLTGLAWSVLGLQLLIFLPVWRYLVTPCCGISAKEYVSELLPPFILAAIAGAVAWLGAHDLQHGVVRLFVGGLVGLVAYVSLSFRFNRRWASWMSDLLGLPAWIV